MGTMQHTRWLKVGQKTKFQAARLDPVQLLNYF